MKIKLLSSSIGGGARVIFDRQTEWRCRIPDDSTSPVITFDGYRVFIERWDGVDDRLLCISRMMCSELPALRDLYELAWYQEGKPDDIEVCRRIASNPYATDEEKQYASRQVAAAVARESRRPPIPRHLRQAIIRRDGGMCRYCGAMLSKKAHLDHVVPWSFGGATDIDNLVAACPKCNIRKANRTPEDAGMPLLELAEVPA